MKDIKNKIINVFKKNKRIIALTALFLFVVIMAVLASYITSAVFIINSIEIFDDSDIVNFRSNLITYIYDINGSEIARLYSEKREYASLDEIPAELQNAFIAVEDRHFYSHNGFSLPAITRAAIVNLKAGGVVQGGSTITQQLAKNLISKFERTYSRKIKEILISVQLEKNYTKTEIMEMYLNEIYFGSGVYGVKAAAYDYFRKELDGLTLAECALLAAIPKNPSRFNPRRFFSYAKARQRVVLNSIYEAGFIDENSYEKALNEELVIYPGIPLSEYNKAPYFVDYVKGMLLRELGTDEVFRGGLEVYTTLDINWQTAADSIFKATGYQGGIVAVDPRNGHIKVMVGGRDYEESQFNRAVQAKRQPGSAYKPFTYLTALERGYTAAHIIEDLPLYYDGEIEWMPSNYSKRYYGSITLQRALEQSYNIPAIRLAEKTGIRNVIRTIQRFDLEVNEEGGLGITLGVSEADLLTLTNAFGSFGNNGILSSPLAVLYVKNNEEQIIFQEPSYKKTVTSPENAYILTKMLQRVITHGTGWRAYSGRPAAGKTGTTDNYTNAWFIGYTPELASGVYIGNDDNSPIETPSGRPAGGGYAAAPIWKSVMENIFKDAPKRDFMASNKIIFRTVDLISGKLASTQCRDKALLPFINGTEPSEICDAH